MGSARLLVVGDPGSIHAARFVSLLQEIGHDVRVFQSLYRYSQDEHLHDAIVYVSQFAEPPANGNTLRVSAPFEMDFRSGALGDALKILQKGVRHFIGEQPRSAALAKTIRNWRPDIVFSLKMQNDGYTVSEAKKQMGADFRAKWIHFNWGTDLEFFGKHPDYVGEHLPRIRQLLSQCDFHMADCMRDVRQAADFGFKGRSLGMCLANGGFDLGDLREIREQAGKQRNVILIKGRQGSYVGKAFNVFEALHRIPQIARQYKVKVILADVETRGAAAIMSRIDGIDYEVLPRLPYRELLALYASSRMAISASDVDGTPSFLTESMAMGAFPIHSDMDSVREWIVNGDNGLLFPVDDIAALVSCIEKAHADDLLVQNARTKNWQITAERMDRDKIRQHVRELIETVSNDND